MRITALIENDTRNEEFVAQYGLSLFVETEHGNIVVDAGQDECALANFQALGYSENAIGAIFVSHNHYDHIGGLQSFIDATAKNKTPVYASSAVGRDLYTKKFLRKRKLVSRNDLFTNNPDRFVFVDDQTEIFPSVYACRVANPQAEFACKDKKLKMLGQNGKLVPDDFSHEIYLAVIENDTVKIVSSCSHNGIVNIVEDAKSRFNLPVSAFVGGLHFRGSSSRALNCSKKYAYKVFEKIETLDIGKICTCHCTGYPAYKMLKGAVSCPVRYFGTAEKFNV